jgi:2-polyprenyl-3-methyl-5-hydroxy-6-metoxy-1,4-benzoquinol methylase
MHEKLRYGDPGLPTSSIWTEPTRRFFRFLNNIEHSGLPKKLAVLGCSDGTYVIPAARRGFDVLAIDTDRTALYGGTVPLHEKNSTTVGLINRLAIEQLEEKVMVVCEDFVLYNEDEQGKFSGVFTSGSIHYQENSQYPLDQILKSIQSYVATGGLLLVEYIHRSEHHSDPLKYFMTGKEIVRFFPTGTWNVSSNKKKRYTENPNPRNGETHDIAWGRLYAQKLT